jgi:hypothetical protein
MTVHQLKCFSKYWDQIESGHKTFEVRFDDRNYKVGDILIIRRGTNRGTNTRVLRRRITYKLDGGKFGIMEGYCVLGLSDEILDKEAALRVVAR